MWLVIVGEVQGNLKEALMLLSYLAKCSHCSWQWQLFSDMVLVAWVVVSITISYSHPLGEQLRIQVKDSLGAAMFINTNDTKFCISESSGNRLVLGMPLHQVLHEKGPKSVCPTLAVASFLLYVLHVLPAEVILSSTSWAKTIISATLPPQQLPKHQSDRDGGISEKTIF